MRQGRSPRFVIVSNGGIWLALLASYFAAGVLPGWAGWENGPVENAQVVLLLAGGVLALAHRQALARADDAQGAVFWLVVAPIWFAMAARELSWGAAFMTPIDFSPTMGPAFSSSQQLPYKSLVAPLLGVILLGVLWAFVRTRQDQTLARLWRTRSLPLLEVATFVLGMVVSAASEGHMGLAVAGLGEAEVQTYEELAELWAYAALLLAQSRVWAQLRQDRR